jgi:mycofactocin precursor
LPSAFQGTRVPLYHGPMPTPDTAQAVLLPPPTRERDDEDLVEEELLVEEISIDGMCGVY